jgi:hypothetical protein
MRPHARRATVRVPFDSNFGIAKRRHAKHQRVDPKKSNAILMVSAISGNYHRPSSWTRRDGTVAPAGG